MYRGWLLTPEPRIESPETLSITTHGLMERLDRWMVKKKYVYGLATDIATVFSDIVADHVTTASRLPSLTVDSNATSVKVKEFDARGKSVSAALGALCDTAPNAAIWGFDFASDTTDRIYLRPRSTSIAYRAYIAGNVTAFVYPRDVTQVVNRMFIRGGRVSQPNMLGNPSFEEPAPNSETVGNLILNYGFEDPTGWTLSGGATIKDSGDTTVEHAAARTGDKLLELDTPGEEAYQIVSSIDYTIPYLASCYVRRESAGIAADVTITVDGLDSGSSPVSGATVSSAAYDPGGSQWKRLTLAVDFSAYATVVKLKVRFITSLGSEGATGTLIDDTALWETNGVSQEGWTWSTTGAGKRDILDWVHDAIAPYHGGYVVKMKATGIAISADCLEIWTPLASRVKVTAAQFYTLAVFVRGDGTNDISFSFGVTQYKADATVATTTESATITGTYATWSMQSLGITMGADTDTVQVFLRDRNNNILYVDALALLDGNLPTDWSNGGYWAGDAYEIIFDVTNTPATERRPDSGVTGDALTSITDYGEREASVSNDQVVDFSSAVALAVSYLNAYATPRIQAELKTRVRSASDLINMAGAVKLVNLPDAPDALFPARVSYTIGDNIDLVAQLGNEKAELIGLMRLLAAKV
jgi:hypothetical protein